jgi:NADH:ubiquinone oxidoreductase subunit E
MKEMVEQILQKFPPGKKENLIPLLQEIQRISGHLSEDVLNEVSRHINIPLNKIYGVASFYDQFCFKGQGKVHIRLCNGTSCHISRSDVFRTEIEKILHVTPGQTTRDGKYSFELVNCFGACSRSPVLFVNSLAYGDLTKEQLIRLLSSVKESTE